MGLRYRKNVPELPGKPDLVFAGPRVAVFCDGDFWHGRKWSTLEAKLSQGVNAGYWTAKIASNIERDARNTALLNENGWYVIRLWETDIKRDPYRAASQVREVIRTLYTEADQTGKASPRGRGSA